MPCRDCDDYGIDKEKQALKERLDEVTQMLCWLCGQVSYSYSSALISRNPKLVQWWNEHLKSDNRRVLDEMRTYVRRNPNQTQYGVAEYFIQKAQAVHAVSDFHKEWFRDLANKAVAEGLKEQYTQDKKNKLRDDILSRLTPEERNILGY